MKKTFLNIVVLTLIGVVGWHFLKPKEDQSEIIIKELNTIARQAEETPTLTGIPLFSHVRSFKQYLSEDFKLHIEELNMTIPNRDEFIKKATQAAPMIPHFSSDLSSFDISFDENQHAQVEFTLQIKGHGKSSHFNETRQMQLKMVEFSTWKIIEARVLQPISN